MDSCKECRYDDVSEKPSGLRNPFIFHYCSLDNFTISNPLGICKKFVKKDSE